MNVLIIILGLLPGFVWLLFYLEEDSHPEPKRMIALTFAAGAVSAIVALVGQVFITCVFRYGLAGCAESIAGGVDFVAYPLLILIFAVIEEAVKFGAVYFVAAKTKYFDEPIDAMVYMAVAALGFATVENLAALSGVTALGVIFETAAFRFVGTTLLHTLTASITGYFWAHEIRNFKRGLFILYGLILASVLHVIFNYLILVGDNLLYAIVFVATVGFFVLGDFEKLRGKEI